MARKSYNEKLNNSGDLPKVETISDPKYQARYNSQTMLIAAPLQYDAVEKRIPLGKVTTSAHIREHLAKRHGADVTCPLTAGIFINIVAGASEERQGQDITPYWRTLRAKGELNEKYPGGIDSHKLLLEEEGHTIIQKGKRYFVKDYETNLYDLD